MILKDVTYCKNAFGQTIELSVTEADDGLCIKLRKFNIKQTKSQSPDDKLPHPASRSPCNGTSSQLQHRTNGSSNSICNGDSKTRRTRSNNLHNNAGHNSCNGERREILRFQTNEIHPIVIDDMRPLVQAALPNESSCVAYIFKISLLITTMATLIAVMSKPTERLNLISSLLLAILPYSTLLIPVMYMYKYSRAVTEESLLLVKPLKRHLPSTSKREKFIRDQLSIPIDASSIPGGHFLYVESYRFSKPVIRTLPLGNLAMGERLTLSRVIYNLIVRTKTNGTIEDTILFSHTSPKLDLLEIISSRLKKACNDQN